MPVGEDRRYAETTTILATESGLQSGLQMSWGGVWGGLLIAMGVLILLATLGLAIGVTAVDVGPGEDFDGRALGMGAAIWSGLSLLIALFVGGLAAARLGMVFDRTNAMMQGALTWVLAIIAIIWLAASGIGLVASGAFGLVGGVVQTAATTAGATDLGDLATGDPDEVLARLEEPQTVRTIAAATDMPEAEVRSTIARIRQNVEAARDNPEQAAAELRRGTEEFMRRAAQRLERAAGEAQPVVTRSMWFTFLALLLSLAAAVGGALLGGRQVATRLALPPEAMTPPDVRY
jgi:hypothetical protein